MRSKKPDILYCKKGQKKIYDHLKNDENLFRKAELKDIYIIAVVLGFMNGKRSRIDKREPGGLIREAYLIPEDRAIIKSIAVGTEEKLDILIDEKQVYLMSEEYACWGIEYLEKQVFEIGEFGNYRKRLGTELLEMVNKINSKNT